MTKTKMDLNELFAKHDQGDSLHAAVVLANNGQRLLY